VSRWTAPLAAVLGILLGAVAVLWWQGGADPGRARIEGVVRDYVLAHPEIIPEAMGKLQERESARALAGRRAAVETPFGAAWTGNPKGDVTVVEYLDYNCGYCRASLPVIDRLVAEDPGVRVVYRDLPILADSSRAAARASLTAAAQGKFRRFHDSLYAMGPVTDQTIAAAAQAAGFDAGRTDPRADAEIRRNMDSARALGMTGTPSWVIGDRVLSGALPLEELQKAIAAARAR
jgi:protein-disulfide isomerase